MTHNDFVHLLTLRLVGLGVDLEMYLNHSSYTIRNLVREEGWCANIPRHETRRDFLDKLVIAHGDHFSDIQAKLREDIGKVSKDIHSRTGYSNSDVQEFISAIELALWDQRISHSAFLTAAGCGMSTYRSILTGAFGVGKSQLKRLIAGLEKLNIKIELSANNPIMSASVEHDLHHQAAELRLQIGDMFCKFRLDTGLPRNAISKQTSRSRRYVGWLEKGFFCVIDDRFYDLLNTYTLTVKQRAEMDRLIRKYKIVQLKIYLMEKRRISAKYMLDEFFEYVNIIRDALKDKDWQNYFCHSNRILEGDTKAGVCITTIAHVNDTLRQRGILPKHENVFLTV